MRASILTLLAFVVTIVFLFPLFWTVSLSIRPATELYAVPGWGIPWLDFTPTFDAWSGELTYPGMGLAAAHSTEIGVGAMLLAMVLGLPASWALARRSLMPRAGLVVACLLVIRLLPPVALVVPVYLMAAKAGLLDTALALVLINATLVFPLVVVLMRQAFADIPPELEEAAAVDGAGPLRTFVSIVLPLTAPAIVATGLILLAFAWNDYMFAASLLALKMNTLPVLTSGYNRVVREGAVDMLICVSVPMVAALLAQRWLVSVLSFGTVRG